MGNEIEDFLREAHRAAPGRTARIFAALRDDDGRSTYERLSQLVPARSTPRVLDLACGDGVLLEHVHARAPGSALFGVDLSPDELALARVRVPGAELVLGRAQSLPWADASFDLVTCHMSFMLFESVEEVVAEIARVLAPGGRVGLVVGRRETEGGVAKVYGDTFRALAEEMSVTGMTIGDLRTRDAEGLRELFAEGFDDVRCTHVEVGRRTDVDGLWQAYRDMYRHAWLTPDQQEELERRFRAAVDHDAEGMVVDVRGVIELVGMRAAV